MSQIVSKVFIHSKVWHLCCNVKKMPLYFCIRTKPRFIYLYSCREVENNAYNNKCVLFIINMCLWISESLSYFYHLQMFDICNSRFSWQWLQRLYFLVFCCSVVQLVITSFWIIWCHIPDHSIFYVHIQIYCKCALVHE